MHGDTQAVRPHEQLDWAALAAYLRWHLRADHIKGLDLSAAMEVSQFPGGHSNLTYLVRLGGAELVVRRAPFGPVAPTAHDMAREYRWLAALNPIFAQAPRPYLLCADANVIGAPFFVMERRRGMVVRHEEPLPLANRPEVRRRVSEALVDTLVVLHAIDVIVQPLAALGRPAGFIDRQVRGWTERWHRSKLTEIPEMDDVAAWLAGRIPPDPARPAIVHGDFKLDNLLLDPLDPSRILAVFDWEMSALGDPLMDLGFLIVHWTPTGPPADGDALAPVTERPGWFTREEIVERYADRSGRDVSQIRFYETLARFKLAVVIQQIYYRFRQGQTDDPRFANFGARVEYLAGTAAAALDA